MDSGTQEILLTEPLLASKMNYPPSAKAAIIQTFVLFNPEAVDHRIFPWLSSCALRYKDVWVKVTIHGYEGEPDKIISRMIFGKRFLFSRKMRTIRNTVQKMKILLERIHLVVEVVAR
jgi:hypothetical protein